MVDFIIWAAIFQGLFLSVLYFTSKTHNSFSNKILALFLIALLQEAVNLFLPLESFAGYELGHYFSLPESKLFLPALFLHYVLLKIDLAKKYKLFLKSMYVVAFLFLLLTFINVLLFAVSGKSLQDYLDASFIADVYMAQQTVACVLCIIILIISPIELYRYQQAAKIRMSDMSLMQINWLWQFVISMMLVTSLWAIEVIRILIGGIGTSNIAYSAWVVLFLFIYYASYKAFVHKDLFGIPEERINPVEAESIESNISSAVVLSDDLTQMFSTIESIMIEQKLFLNSNLTIYELAKAAKISSRKISQSINQVKSQNFSEWVNSYRIEKAKGLLQEISSSNYTIEGIGYDSGFNSRSAMYLAFKKITGQSPGDFKG